MTEKKCLCLTIESSSEWHFQNFPFFNQGRQWDSCGFSCTVSIIVASLGGGGRSDVASFHTISVTPSAELQNHQCNTESLQSRWWWAAHLEIIQTWGSADGAATGSCLPMDKRITNKMTLLVWPGCCDAHWRICSVGHQSFLHKPEKKWWKSRLVFITSLTGCDADSWVLGALPVASTHTHMHTHTLHIVSGLSLSSRYFTKHVIKILRLATSLLPHRKVAHLTVTEMVLGAASQVQFGFTVKEICLWICGCAFFLSSHNMNIEKYQISIKSWPDQQSFNVWKSWTENWIL